ncbi:uncharacterized protein LOC130993088 [Salvia miltiorrhiza]|uniref:uncharacterized protein LOC130993088 n=1 Tax=Salvia miltiorrhiza TaxID=226208 RepID=UPI0025AB8722|nr:uncharacterized protein LOC130993088 [Salvia miltiorrhiza]
MKDHFEKYGDILEAIISDKLTGRSKGYGFITFKDADAAKKACEDPTPIINGRRANCNLAGHGGCHHDQARPQQTPIPSPATATAAQTPWFTVGAGVFMSPLPKPAADHLCRQQEFQQQRCSLPLNNLSKTKSPTLKMVRRTPSSAPESPR